MAWITLLAALLADPALAARPYQSVGFKPTAIPLLNFSSDDGAGYGLRVSLFDYDGESVPYRRAWSLQAFFTTEGKWVHRLAFDTPNIRPGERLEVEAVFEKEESANFFGDLDDDALDTYSRDQRTFRQAFPELTALWIRDLRLPWRLRVGTRLTRNDVDPNDDVRSTLRDVAPLGAEGGTLVQLEAALRYDTRDDYTNATTGHIEEALVGYALGGGGDFNSLLFSLDHRRFLSPVDGFVLAYRLDGDVTLGDLPFYEELELGGSSSVRGLPASRDRGESRLLANGEIRWRGLPLWRSQHVYLGGVLFIDAGHTFETADGPSTSGWRRSRGAGLRFLWHSTVVRADYGLSGDRTAIYITFSHVF